ncbi:MAG: hypothetical protein H6730_38280 [Deltaproteobacteria bacterium]|nr:hypothetical protein [Deltaproteobacteria bacterium]
MSTHLALRLIPLAIVLGVTTGCPDGSEAPPLAVCAPGAEQACTCTDGASGLHTCKADGSGFDACACSCQADCSGRACGLDPVCNQSCGTCGNDEACSADFQCVGAALTLAGHARARGVLSLSAGGETYRTNITPSLGYELALPVLDGDTLVVLHLSDASANVELYSVVDTFGALVQRAGADRVVTDAEHRGLRIDEISTARAAALTDSNGGALPTTQQEVLAAMPYLNDRLRTSTLLECAALLGRAIDGLYQLPPALSTWELARELGLCRDQVRAQQPTAFVIGGPLTTAATQLLAVESVGTPLSLVGSWEHNLRRRRAGRIAGTFERLVFRADGTGTHHFAPSGAKTVQPERAFTWRDVAGRVELTDDGDGEESISMTKEELATLVDPSLAAQVSQRVPDRISVRRILVYRTYVRLDEGTDVAWIGELSTYDFLLDEALAPFGIQTPDVRRALPSADLWHRTEALTPIPLTASEVSGRWALNIRANVDRGGALGDFAAGDALVVAALVDFAPNGTAVVAAGSLATPSSLAWALDPEGRLELSFPDGTTQSITRIEDTGQEQGYLHTLRSAEGTSVLYERDRRVDPSFTLTPQTLATPASEYWQTTINYAIYDSPADHDVALEEIFGFRFTGGSMMDSVTFGDDFQNPYDINPRYSGVRFNGSDVEIELGYNEAGDFGNCVDSPPCLPLRVRVWRPIATSGDTFYVVESYVFLAQWQEIQARLFSYDAAQGAWTDGAGNTVDLDSRVYLFPSRINAYRRRAY